MFSRPIVVHSSNLICKRGRKNLDQPSLSLYYALYPKIDPNDDAPPPENWSSVPMDPDSQPGTAPAPIFGSAATTILAESNPYVSPAPIPKNLWQRGLSLYYLHRFKEGAQQFRLDVDKNPNDTEESIWCFLCEAQMYGVEEARKQMLQVGRDPRPIMREAYEMFKNGGDPDKFVAEFKGRDDDYFYASVYAGLYYESEEKKADDAKVHIVAACQSPYGQRSQDYMAALAKVHCLRRLWS